MEQSLPVQGQLADLSFATWRVHNHTWQTRWVQHCTGTAVLHCTVRVGDWVLHVDDKISGWYPARSITRIYPQTYELVDNIYLGKVPTNIQEPLPGNAWSIIRWRYLFGPTPQGCTTICATALRQHGIELEPDLVFLSDIVRNFDDCTRIQWEG